MIQKMPNMKFKKFWINFWGKRYRVYENNVLIKEVIFYHHKIYVENKEY
jgi:hypothetical protein